MSNTNLKEQIKKPSFKMLCVIVEHDKADEVVELLELHGLNNCLIIGGKGTATDEILDLLGLGDSKKDVMFYIVKSDSTKPIIDKICQHYDGTGIAFSVRLNSIGGSNTLALLEGIQNFNG